MLDRRFESLLIAEVAKTDLAQRMPDDVPRRFDSLRGYRLLPTGRAKNVTHLTAAQMASAILSITTANPAFAGLAATTLSGLRPVGGIDASFQQCSTLGTAVESLLQDPRALDRILELRVSDSEIYTNSHGRGAITFSSRDITKTAYYVGHTALSLLRPGASQEFSHRSLISSVITETVFYASFFRSIADELKREASAPPIPVVVPPEDEDEDTRNKDRTKRLGILPNSRFLNLGVDNQVTWPAVETPVQFEGYQLILLPKTAEHTTSIHIDLLGQRIGSEKPSRSSIGC
jgi:hypothetical protein